MQYTACSGVAPCVRVYNEDLRLSRGAKIMAADPKKVYPSGLTIAEAEELHSHVINGTRTFGAIAVVAHALAYVLTPWLH